MAGVRGLFQRRVPERFPPLRGPWLALRPSRPLHRRIQTSEWLPSASPRSSSDGRWEPSSAAGAADPSGIDSGFEALLDLAFILLGYLAGSIPTGVLLARRAGVDLRSEGSGNVGATNVARTAGRSLGLLTLAGDLLKGFTPVVAARAMDFGLAVVAGVGVAAIVGHVYSIFLHFQGGKGVATGFGVLLGLAPGASLVPLAVFVTAVSTTRIVSIGSMAAAMTAPLTIFLFGYPPPIVWAAVTISGLILLRHRDNVSRLVAGTEEHFRVRK